MYVYLGGHASPFVSELGVKLDDDLLFFLRESTFLEIGAEMVGPSESATFAAPGQPRIPLYRVPIPLAVLLHVLYQNRVFRRRPRPFLHVLFLLAAGAVSRRLNVNFRQLFSSFAVDHSQHFGRKKIESFCFFSGFGMR